MSTPSLTLVYQNHARADPTNANRGNCESHYAEGDFHTRLEFEKLVWRDESLLRIDAKDTTYATVVQGSGSFNAWPAEVGSAADCAADHSKLGEAVVDLRGTPYAIAPVIAMVLDMILPVDKDEDATEGKAAETADA